MNTITEEVIGDGQVVTKIRVKNTLTEVVSEIPVTGFFLAIGHKPNTDIFTELELDETGYIIAKPGSTQTNIPGVFAAGDVADHVYRQATAAEQVVWVALDAWKILNGDYNLICHIKSKLWQIFIIFSI